MCRRPVVHVLLIRQTKTKSKAIGKLRPDDGDPLVFLLLPPSLTELLIVPRYDSLSGINK